MLGNRAFGEGRLIELPQSCEQRVAIRRRPHGFER